MRPERKPCGHLSARFLKTTWPTKEEATRLTAVVIGVIVVLGIYMGVLDTVLSLLVNRFSLLK